MGKRHQRRLLLEVCLGLGMLVISGCSMRICDFSVIATKNVSLDKVDLDALPQVKGVTGEDSRFILVFIPFGVPHLEDAIDDALDKGNGDVMIDAVVHSKGWWFVVGETALTVKGTVVNTRGNRQ